MPLDATTAGIRFDEAEHRYYDFRGEVPGVTRVLESQGLLTLPKESEALAFARDLGKAVHKATELHDRGELDADTVSPLVKPYLDAWILFKEQVGIEIEATELRVYEPNYRYAGTLDRLARWKHRGRRLTLHGLIDIKTGAPQRATGPQTAAYLNALPRSERKRVRYAVHLDTLGQYHLQGYYDPGDFGTFLSALNLYNWKAQ